MPIAMNNKHYEIRLTDTDNKIYKINNMEYSEDFKGFVEKCIENNQFVGFGNPSEKVLIIGKEVSTDKQSNKDIDKQNTVSINQNSKEWCENINNGTLQSEVPMWHFIKKLPLCKVNNNPLFPWKGSLKKDTSDTWKKYQKLHDIVFKEQIDHDNNKMIDFLEEFFITEMNQIGSRTTSEAQEAPDFNDNLKFRKNNIINSDYIRAFPVVVLACSDYISNNDKDREIDNIFEVVYDGHPKNKYQFDKNNSFFLHHSTDKNQSRLVIHTRQLSGSVKDEMLIEIGKIIREHLDKIENAS
jgi:hypothetical protein